MTCGTCGDRGVVRLNWADAPEEYAVCLCEAGLHLRHATNDHRAVEPLWLVWAAREGVPLASMCMVEDVLTEEELRARGLKRPAHPTTVAREAALLAAGKGKRR